MRIMTMATMMEIMIGTRITESGSHALRLMSILCQVMIDTKMARLYTSSHIHAAQIRTAK